MRQQRALCTRRARLASTPNRVTVLIRRRQRRNGNDTARGVWRTPLREAVAIEQIDRDLALVTAAARGTQHRQAPVHAAERERNARSGTGLVAGAVGFGAERTRVAALAGAAAAATAAANGTRVAGGRHRRENSRRVARERGGFGGQCARVRRGAATHVRKAGGRDARRRKSRGGAVGRMRELRVRSDEAGVGSERQIARLFGVRQSAQCESLCHRDASLALCNGAAAATANDWNVELCVGFERLEHVVWKWARLLVLLFGDGELSSDGAAKRSA